MTIKCMTICCDSFVQVMTLFRQEKGIKMITCRCRRRHVYIRKLLIHPVKYDSENKDLQYSRTIKVQINLLYCRVAAKVF